MSTHLEVSEERVNDAGLTVTHRVGYSAYQTYDGFTESERTEAFVVEFVRDQKLPGGHLIAPAGSRAYVWRIKYLASDFGSPKAGAVSINGFARDGRQTIGYNSDEEAARYIRTVRNPDGTVLKASDDPKYTEAARRYRQMMSY